MNIETRTTRSTVVNLNQASHGLRLTLDDEALTFAAGWVDGNWFAVDRTELVLPAHVLPQLIEALEALKKEE